jgi:hypothetical protein
MPIFLFYVIYQTFLLAIWPGHAMNGSSIKHTWSFINLNGILETKNFSVTETDTGEKYLAEATCKQMLI